MITTLVHPCQINYNRNVMLIAMVMTMVMVMAMTMTPKTTKGHQHLNNIDV